MTIWDVVRLAGALAIVVSVTAQGSSVQAQQRGGTAQTDEVRPINSGANPYRVIRDWAQLTLEKRPWGGSNGVAVDRDGKSVNGVSRKWGQVLQSYNPLFPAQLLHTTA